ncbi:MAG: hypothetical protein IJX95_04030, partial [Lachnospiraceae bacterium]|nr:hypothetical protein [Lachnospiraceae bacterium]
MKKAIVLGLTVLGLLCLSSCKKEQGQEQPGARQEEQKKESQKETGKKENNSKKTHKFVPEDFIPGGGSEVLQTEKGYYYLNSGNIRYKDFATGNDIFLCNKPECRHDGNEFCVATNDKYVICEMRLYNGKLFAVATETTETQCMYKLLLVEPDGSTMDELVTYMTMERTGQVPAGLDDFQIHRNLVMLPFAAIDAQKFSDTDAYGTALYNLDTGELVYLDEEPFDRENSAAFSIQGYQDWIYYCRYEEGKTRLHRYNLTDGTDETYTMLPSFAGIYGIKDENTVVYMKCDGNGKAGNEFCVCHTDTGENEIVSTLMRKEKNMWNDGTVHEEERMYSAIHMTMDDTYVYVFGKEERGERRNAETGEWGPFYDSYLQIYDHDLNKLTEYNFGDVLAEAVPELAE